MAWLVMFLTPYRSSDKLSGTSSFWIWHHTFLSSHWLSSLYSLFILLPCYHHVGWFGLHKRTAMLPNFLLKMNLKSSNFTYFFGSQSAVLMTEGCQMRGRENRDILGCSLRNTYTPYERYWARFFLVGVCNLDGVAFFDHLHLECLFQS